jgi:class 3 adenylate cyclase
VALLYRDPASLGAAPQVITALDVMLTPDFKHLFAQDALSQRESLSIKNLTVLFTDNTGSTALYQRLGDVRAYNLVRDHFDVLFREIQNFKGVVVKTIGDAVMAAFPAPDLAVQAALAVQKNIREFNRARNVEDGIILVKIGLHAGSAIAVNLNNTLDYFGNMVNLAARIQSKSRSEEVLISEEVYQDAAVQTALAADKGLILSNSLFELHGIGERRLYSIMSQ